MKKNILLLSLIIATFFGPASAMEPKKRKVLKTSRFNKIPNEVIIFKIFKYFDDINDLFRIRFASKIQIHPHRRWL